MPKHDWHTNSVRCYREIPCTQWKHWNGNVIFTKWIHLTNPTMHQTNIPKCAHTCTFLLKSGALWDTGLAHCGIFDSALALGVVLVSASVILTCGSQNRAIKVTSLYYLHNKLHLQVCYYIWSAHLIGESKICFIYKSRIQFFICIPIYMRNVGISNQNW